MPAKRGRIRRIDYEYRRCGTINFFMMFEPLGSLRHVKVTDERKREDFAECLRDLVDIHYPAAEKIVLVMDNLNTHSPASLYATFPPAEARRIAEKFEIHYTPKHGSWLNMAEIEIGVLSRQCLTQYIDTRERMELEVVAWVKTRNEAKLTVNWQFTNETARVKLYKLYPAI